MSFIRERQVRIMYYKDDILSEITDWEREIDRLSKSEFDESEQIKELQERVDLLYDILRTEECE